jgi:hypothetical protein
VTELDQFWAAELAAALEKAKSAGRGDIADYLTLRASNDFLRSVSVKWLMSAFIDTADEFRVKGRPITLETNTKHEFKAGVNTMVGSKLKFSLGLRALSVEAGWTRLPEHGFIRGNGLAQARVSHFGLHKANKDLLLVKIGERPVWVVQEEEFVRTPLFEDFFHQHFSLLLDEK